MSRLHLLSLIPQQVSPVGEATTASTPITVVIRSMRYGI